VSCFAQRLLAVCITSVAALLAAWPAGAAGPQTPERPGLASCRENWRIDHWCGWHFYEDPEDEEEPKKDAPAKPDPKPLVKKKDEKPSQPAELQAMKDQQRRLEDLRHVAIITPSEENVRRYLEFEQFVYRQANTFSEVARRVGLTMGPLMPDNSARPTSSLAARVFDDQKRQSATARLDDLKNTHALFYFFRSDCPYCKSFSPTLARFEQQLGIKVVPISLDGRGTPEFPSFKTDNGIATTLKVDSVPALFLAEPGQGKVIALGSGVMSQQEIIERISLAVDPDTERLAPGLITSLSSR
jgi:conjugal transfer pilus assembly protein TraF